MTVYGMTISVPGSLAERKQHVVDALKTQGFGILTEIDVQKTMKEKIGVDYEPYLILGACNPGLAHRSLSSDRLIGLLLPCNVVLRQVGANVEVSILDPQVMFSVVEPKTLEELGTLPQEAKNLLQAALDNIVNS